MIKSPVTFQFGVRNGACWDTVEFSYSFFSVEYNDFGSVKEYSDLSGGSITNVK